MAVVNKPCQYPQCSDLAVDRKYCRRHRSGVNRFEVLKRKARSDRSPAEEWYVLSLVSLGSGCITRTMICRDPIRRRDEMQSGCPWTLTMSAVIFAPKPTLEAIVYLLEREVIAHPRALSKNEWTGLRESWWPFDAPVLESMMVDVCDRLEQKGIKRPATPRDLKKLSLDKSQPEQYRLHSLLSLLEKR